MGESLFPGAQLTVSLLTPSSKPNRRLLSYGFSVFWFRISFLIYGVLIVTVYSARFPWQYPKTNNFFDGILYGHTKIILNNSPALNHFRLGYSSTTFSLKQSKKQQQFKENINKKNANDQMPFRNSNSSYSYQNVCCNCRHPVQGVIRAVYVCFCASLKVLISLLYCHTSYKDLHFRWRYNYSLSVTCCTLNDLIDNLKLKWLNFKTVSLRVGPVIYKQQFHIQWIEFQLNTRQV